MKKQTRIWSAVMILIVVGAMSPPAASGQSIWQKMKQAAKQAEANAQAQQHRAQPTSARASTARSSQPAAAGNTPSAAAAAPVNVDSPALKALYRKLDIGGVQIGMTPQAAQAALMGRNRAFVKGRAQPFAFTDLPNVEFTSHADFVGKDEHVLLGLTLQPMQPEVLSIFSATEYAIDHMPPPKTLSPHCRPSMARSHSWKIHRPPMKYSSCGFSMAGATWFRRPVQKKSVRAE